MEESIRSSEELGRRPTPKQKITKVCPLLFCLLKSDFFFLKNSSPGLLPIMEASSVHLSKNRLFGLEVTKKFKTEYLYKVVFEFAILSTKMKELVELCGAFYIEIS